MRHLRTVVGWKMSPQKILHPNSWNPWMLPYTVAKRITDFEMGRLSWIIQEGPKCNHMYHYKRGRESLHTDTRWRRWCEDRRNRFEDTGREYFSDTVRHQGMPAATRSWKRQGRSLPSTSEGTMTLPTSLFQQSNTDFRLLASRTVK